MLLLALVASSGTPSPRPSSPCLQYPLPWFSFINGTSFLKTEPRILSETSPSPPPLPAMTTGLIAPHHSDLSSIFPAYLCTELEAPAREEPIKAGAAAEAGAILHGQGPTLGPPILGSFQQTPNHDGVSCQVWASKLSQRGQARPTYHPAISEGRPLSHGSDPATALSG